MTSPYFYGLTLLLLYGVVILEVLYIRRRDGTKAPWREVVVNMNSGQMVLWLLRGVRAFVYTGIYTVASLHWLDALPVFILLPLTFVLWDLAFYTSHYAHHKIPILWDVHVLHHQGESFNTSLAVRNAWLQVLTPTPFFAVLAILGVPPELYFSIGAIHYIVQIYNHNGAIRQSGVLDHFLVTPTHHKVHHARNTRYLDRNFGSSLIVWDKVFGTFAKEDPAEPVEVGLHDAPRSENALWLNLEPLTRRLGRGGPDIHLPDQAEDVGEHWLLVGSALSFALMCAYVMDSQDWDAIHSAAIAGYVILGTMVLGRAADGHRDAVAAWIVLSWTALAVYLGTEASDGTLETSAMVALAGHSAWRVPWLLQRKVSRYFST